MGLSAMRSVRSARKAVSRISAGLLLVTGVAVAHAAKLSMDEICGDCKAERYASCGSTKFLEGPSFDPHGNLWLVGLLAGEILKVTPDRTCSVVAKGGAPNGTRYLKSGKLLITDRDRNLITYDPATNAFETVATKFRLDTLRGLNDMVIDKAGGVYFTEPYGSNALRPNGRVFYLPPQPKADLKLLADIFAFPNGIALSPDEKRLYVADYSTNRIIAVAIGEPGEVNFRANSYVFAQLRGGVGPDGLAVDANGNVYAAHNYAGEIVVLNPNGHEFGAIKLPDDAGILTTNVVFRDGYLYITEAGKGEIWRVKTKIPGKPTE